MRRICRNKVSRDGIEIPFTEGKSYIFEISQNMKNQWKWLESEGDDDGIWCFSVEVGDMWHVDKWFFTEQETREMILDDLI